MRLTRHDTVEPKPDPRRDTDRPHGAEARITGASAPGAEPPLPPASVPAGPAAGIPTDNPQSEPAAARPVLATGQFPDHGPLRRPSIVRRLATLGLLCLLALAVLLAVPGLAGVRDQVRHIRPVWMVVAVALELASDFSFVVLFPLFFDRLSGRDARLLAWTEQSAGALLPGGGAGGLAIGGWLMSLTGAPTRWIMRRSAGLFLLTTAVNAATIIAAGLALILGAAGPHDFTRVVLPTVLVAAATLVGAALPRIMRERPHAPRWVRAISSGVQDAEQTAFEPPSWRLLGAFGYLGFDIAVLWVCLKALAAAPSIPALILAYNIGYLANALPIPGGIGVLSAGLTAALALYGTSATHAAAAVLVYRAIALWIPGLGGLLAYLRLRPRLAPGAATAKPPMRLTSPQPHPQRTHTMNGRAVMLRPVRYGWKIETSDGHEVARFTGPGAKRRALRYITTQNVVRDAGDRR